MKGIDLSIIVVNWNSRDYLMKCMESIFQATISLTFEVVVIDCGSYDGSDDMLRECYPKVRFVQSGRNLGFGRGNNDAYLISRGKTILFLNPDTEIIDGAISQLFNCLWSIKDAGVVGARLLNSDMSIQASCVQSFPTILNQVIDSDFLRTRLPKLKMWGTSAISGDLTTPSKVDAISGACLMIKRFVFESVGMFSVDYFMYCEDIDLCLKAKKAGYKTYFVPSAVVVHHGGSSSSRNPRSTFSSVMMLEAQRIFFEKNRSIGYSRLYRIAMLLAGITRVGILVTLRVSSKVFGRELHSSGSLQNWIARVRWSLGFEKWVKGQP